jgi:uncharacterized protein
MDATRLLDTWARPTRGSLTNAREALTAVVAAVSDRLQLTDAIGTEDDEAGSLHALTREECYQLLRSCAIGRFAYVARAGTPDVVPVNFAVDGDDVLICSGPGPKLQAADRGERVAFEVDDIDPQTRTGRSVVLVGRATRVRGSERARVEQRVAGLPWAAGPRRHVIRIRPTRVTGRRLS